MDEAQMIPFFVAMLALVFSGCSSDPNAAAPADAGRADEIVFTARYGPHPIAPGVEVMKCQDQPGPTESVWISGWHSTAAFTHHVNVYERTSGAAEYPTPTACALSSVPGVGFFGVEQPDLVEHLDEAPEYAGLAFELRSVSDMLWDVHEVNTTPKSGVVDVQVDFFRAERHDLVLHGFSFSGSKSLYVAPGETKLFHYETTSPNEEIKIIRAAAHVHAHNTLATMSVNGVEVYRSTDWSSPVYARYDSLHGAALVVSPSSHVTWECLVKNTTAVALRYANAVQTGEMCIMYGTLIGPKWVYEAP